MFTPMQSTTMADRKILKSDTEKYLFLGWARQLYGMTFIEYEIMVIFTNQKMIKIQGGRKFLLTIWLPFSMKPMATTSSDTILTQMDTIKSDGLKLTAVESFRDRSWNSRKKETIYMKKLTNKKLALAIALGTALTFGASSAMAAPADTTEVAVNVTVQQGTIDWGQGSKSNVTAVGIGLPDNRGAAMSRLAAIMDAQRNLLGIIKGVQVDSDTLMEELIVKSDTVKRSIGGLLQGAQIIDEGMNADGSYYVKMSVPLYGATGSLAAATLPEIVKDITPTPIPVVNTKTTVLKEQEVKKVRSASYTGVIVDAGGMGLEPTFSPVIYDTNGRAVYGISNINPDLAISNGMVGYTNSVEKATGGSRAGSNPLVVKASGVRGGKNSVNPVNVVVSPEDADRILLANEQSGILTSCSVVFVR